MNNQNQANRKNILKAALVLLVSITFQLTGFAQSKKLSTSANIGISVPFLDTGRGIHFGLNPSYRLSPRISVEGQLSYSRTKITRAFWTGEQKDYTTINALTGGRLYLSSEKRRTRFYLNALLGGSYNIKKSDKVKDKNNSKTSEMLLGASFGFYAEHNKFSIGLFGENPYVFGIKMGYKF